MCRPRAQRQTTKDLQQTTDNLQQATERRNGSHRAPARRSEWMRRRRGSLVCRLPLRSNAMSDAGKSALADANTKRSQSSGSSAVMY